MEPGMRELYRIACFHFRKRTISSDNTYNRRVISMEKNTLRMMEKLDRNFVEHLRRITEMDGGAYPAELIAAYEYLKSAELNECDVFALQCFPNPPEIALTCRKQTVNGSGFNFRFLLVKVEAGSVHPLLMVGVKFPSSWRESSRKRREKLTGNQMLLYGVPEP